MCHPTTDCNNFAGGGSSAALPRRRYAVSYMTEAGYWTMTDQEAAGFRAYLLKGGFAIFDDFRGDLRGGGGWENFEANMRRVLPVAQFVDLDSTHPIFHSFFEIDSFNVIPQYYDRGQPVFRGVFENNDPTKRLIAMVNSNTDVEQPLKFPPAWPLSFEIPPTVDRWALSLNDQVPNLRTNQTFMT